MYNQQPDYQHLGIYGIFKESFKLIFKHHKIFKKISLDLILPQFLLSISILIFLPTNNSIPNISTTFLTSSSSPSSSYKWNIYWPIYLIYLVFSTILSLFSVLVVTYTVVCIYTNKDITFRNVLSMISNNACKRLVVTSMCVYLAMFGCSFALVLVIPLLVLVGIDILSIFGIIVVIMLLLIIVYMSIIWQFSSIVSVLETTCGFQAMTKSKTLIKGKMGIAIGIYFVWVVCLVPNYFLMKHLKMNDDGTLKVVFGDNVPLIIFYAVWFTFQKLLNLVVQTVFYLVCKSYHGENVEKDLALVDGVEKYYVEYAPLLNSSLAQVGETNNNV